MNILIINHYIGSSLYGMDYRQYYLAREWVKLGYNVTILGAGYSHLRISQPVVRKDLQTEWIEGIRYLWIKTPKYQSSGLGRVLNMGAFIIKSMLYKNRIIRLFRPDLVLVSSTYALDVYPARMIAKKTGAKLVYELHDLWPLSPMVIGGYSRKHPFIQVIQKAENYACKECDYFISALGNAKEYLVEHGMPEEKFIHVANGFSEDYINSASLPIPFQHRQLLDRLKRESRIIIGYTGGHAPSNALKSFILAAKTLAAKPSIAFVLIGTGSEKDSLIELANSHKQSTIFFLPPVSKNAIPDLLAYFDILYAGGVSSILHRYGTAFNKITDYMLAAKPIVFAVDEPNSLVETVGCGVQVPAENVPEITKALDTLVSMTQEQRNSIGTKGFEYAKRELGYSLIAKKVMEAIGIE